MWDQGSEPTLISNGGLNGLHSATDGSFNSSGQIWAPSGAGTCSLASVSGAKSPVTDGWGSLVGGNADITPCSNWSSGASGDFGANKSGAGWSASSNAGSWDTTAAGASRVANGTHMTSEWNAAAANAGGNNFHLFTQDVSGKPPEFQQQWNGTNFGNSTTTWSQSTVLKNGQLPPTMVMNQQQQQASVAGNPNQNWCQANIDQTTSWNTQDVGHSAIDTFSTNNNWNANRIANTLGLGSKIDQPPPFKVSAPKFNGVEKLNTAAPPPPLWGGPVADARTGGAGWDATGAQMNQFPSRVNPMFNADPIMTRPAPPPVPAQSNMWNGTMANPSDSGVDNSMVWRDPHPKKPLQPDKGTSVWGDPELYKTVQVHRWKNDDESVVDAKSPLALAAAASGVPYIPPPSAQSSTDRAPSVLTGGDCTPPPSSLIAGGDQTGADSFSPSSNLDGEKSSSSNTNDSCPNSDDQKLAAAKSFKSNNNDIANSINNNQQYNLDHNAATPGDAAQRWGLVVSSSTESWSTQADKIQSATSNNTSGALAESSNDDHVPSRNASNHSASILNSARNVPLAANQVHSNYAASGQPQQQSSKFVPNDHIASITKDIKNQIRSAVMRNFLDVSTLNKPPTEDTLQMIHHTLQYSIKLEQCQAEQMKLQQQVQSSSVTPAQNQEYQRLSNEIVYLTSTIQQLKGQIASIQSSDANQANKNGDVFNQSKLMHWRNGSTGDFGKQFEKSPNDTISPAANLILEQNVPSLGLVASNNSLWGTNKSSNWSLNDESKQFETAISSAAVASIMANGVEMNSVQNSMQQRSVRTPTQLTLPPEFRPGTKWEYRDPVKLAEDPNATPATVKPSFLPANGLMSSNMSKPSSAKDFCGSFFDQYSTSMFGANDKVNSFDNMNQQQRYNNRPQQPPSSMVAFQANAAANRPMFPKQPPFQQQSTGGAMPNFNSRVMPPTQQQQQQPWILLSNLNNQISDANLRMFINKVGNAVSFISPPQRGVALFKYRDVPYIHEPFQYLQQQLSPFGIKVSLLASDKDVEYYLQVTGTNPMHQPPPPSMQQQHFMPTQSAAHFGAAYPPPSSNSSTFSSNVAAGGAFDVWPPNAGGGGDFFSTLNDQRRAF